MPELAYPLHQYQYLNGWMWYKARLDIRDEGWKLHVSGTAGNAQAILDRVLPLLRELDMGHKFLLTTEEIEKQQGGQAGKWLAVYPDNIVQAFMAVGEIDRVLNGVVEPLDCPIIVNEKRVGRTVCYTRYGAYASSLYDPDRGIYVDDSIGSIKPDWVRDPWDLYSADPDMRALQEIPLWPVHDKSGWRRMGRRH